MPAMKRMTIVNNFAVTALTAVALAFCVSSSMQAQKNLKGNNQSKVNTFPDCTVVADNIVANCGFETGDFAPEWAFAGPNPEFNFVAGGAAHSGSFGMAMGSIGDVGSISQTLTTVPDQSYTITYWLSNGSPSTPSGFQVYWNDALLVDLVDLPTSAYAQFSIPGQVGTGA